MRTISSALLALATLVLPAAAHAETLDFLITGPANTVQFSVPVNPVPDRYEDGFVFVLYNVPFADNFGGGVVDSLHFYPTPVGGGFSIQDADEVNVLHGINFFGAQLYTGTEANPALLTGDFDLTPIQCTVYVSDCGPVYHLSITPEAVTPEPGSFWLLATGGVGLVTARRRIIG